MIPNRFDLSLVQPGEEVRPAQEIDRHMVIAPRLPGAASGKELGAVQELGTEAHEGFASRRQSHVTDLRKKKSMAVSRWRKETS